VICETKSYYLVRPLYIFAGKFKIFLLEYRFEENISILLEFFEL